MAFSILAHAGGWDEMAIIIFPIVVGGGVWLMTRGGPKTTKPKAQVRPTASTDQKSKPPVFAPPARGTRPPKVTDSEK